MKSYSVIRNLCLVLALAAQAALCGAALADSDEHVIAPRTGMDFSVWEAVPVQEGGVEKSLYTLAKDTVRELTGEAHYGNRSAMENFFSIALEPEAWAHQKVLKFSLPETVKVFGGDKRVRVSPEEFWNKRTELNALAEAKREVKAEVEHAMHKLEVMLGPAKGVAIVPAVDFRGEKAAWTSVEDLASKVKNKGAAEEKLIAAWSDVRAGFLGNDASKFNSASADAISAIGSLDIPMFKPAWKFKLDRWDSKARLFVMAGWVYLISAIAFTISYLAGRKLFTAFAGTTLALGAFLHVAALVIRGILAERTPVANLFESAVFIIGAMTVLSLIISAYYRTRVVGLSGAAMGAFSMGIANNIPLQYGTKILPLVDALQSYWLRIHVTSMLISYAFFSLAFGVAVFYLVRQWSLARGSAGVVKMGGGSAAMVAGGGDLGSAPADVSEDPRLQYLDALNFRIITIGFPILTGGVILGAVWASEAWGRPWAFDPKETAAAITWMIYAIYLHCRLFLGWRGSRGIWLSVLGFAAVVFTYLGVSFFLPGLHSYVEKDGVSFIQFVKNIIPGI